MIEICARTACEGREFHRAKRHLDQRDELYDGPDLALQALPMVVRASAQKLVREAPDLMPEVMDLAHHIEFLRRQIAHVRVDKDRAVRVATMRSESCEVHGEEIQELGRSVCRLDENHASADAARMVLLGFIENVDEMIRDYSGGKLRPDLTVTQLMAALSLASKKTRAAHDRAWKR